MFGSDQMVWPGVIEPAIAIIEDAPFLDPEQKRDIFYNNAAKPTIGGGMRSSK
jgi:predicted TIM-barrel fold metal-dependent hydrolase